MYNYVFRKVCIMNLYKTKFEAALKRIQKPGRYVGNEFNSVHKENFNDLIKFAFCFPDVYELGNENSLSHDE